MGDLYMNLFPGWCFTNNNPWLDKGRIIVAWNPCIYSIDIRICTSQLIHCIAQTSQNSRKFHITFVYGFNEVGGREVLWQDLKDLKTSIEELWMIVVDFNEILNYDERAGRRNHKKPSDSFKECVTHCQMEDLKFSGCFFTWNNKQKPEERIFSKIDRALVNSKWTDSFFNSDVVFLPEGEFDHCPILISFYQDVITGKKPFRYFSMWKTAQNYKAVVRQSWQTPIADTPMYQLVGRLKRLKSVFRTINREGFNEIHKAEMQAKQEMLAIQEAQKAKINWVQNGDENTAIFHASLKAWRACNRINLIRNESGIWMDKPEDIQLDFLSYYQHLLGTSMSNRRKVFQLVVAASPLLSEEHKQVLQKPFSVQEVKDAIFAIPGMKAPGPDGFGSSFYHDNWDLVREEVGTAVINFLNTGMLLKEFNTTTITLIPKVKCPNSVQDFRPISCCNVIYKAATKIICSRLRQILPKLIAENQGGFVHGRYIAYNIMVCQDIVRHYGRKNCKPSCMIKIDLRKDYDTIEWGFIEEMLVAFHFPWKFINLIMVCIKTPRFSLLLNGEMHGFFESKRGLRQGDPMSPLLFVLGMEYLSRIMRDVGSRQGFKYHDRCGTLKLNHMCFADDLLLFCHGDFLSILLLLKGLKLFSLTSGLLPNEEKSTVYCGGMKEAEVTRVFEMSGFTRAHLPFRLLRDVEAICRAFIWKGLADSNGPGLVAWHHVCFPKKAGGLGFRKVLDWNMAAMGKYVWAIATKKDNLFVKWINSVYLMDKNWWDYQLPMDCSWYWKRLVAVKDAFKAKVDLSYFAALRYSIKAGHDLLFEQPLAVSWSKIVWDRLSIPKHRFVIWLVMLQRLRTRDQLHKFKPLVDHSCLLCGGDNESIGHLFFHCHYSSACLQKLKQGMGWNSASLNLLHLIRWIHKAKRMSIIRKNIMYAALEALVYHIWRVRNDVYWNKKLWHVDNTVQRVVRESQVRITLVMPKKAQTIDREWVTKISTN
ncbi:uncharacterized protein LOC133812574 [Humulus lupulus]|uniref:uncharacterized protein LOC133812574 n=1 Tax=Humulus lupulus TaxID=3486 RepID=UPI002B40C7A0|nr:uncharacterized protein LOC133812574 [Humulus lupulus]